MLLDIHIKTHATQRLSNCCSNICRSKGQQLHNTFNNSEVINYLSSDRERVKSKNIK